MKTLGRRRRRGQMLAILAAVATLACAGTALGADPPTITVTGGQIGRTRNPPSFTITGLDTTATITWTLLFNGVQVPETPGPSPLDTGSLDNGDGDYSLQATQTVLGDPAGESLPSPSVTFTLDRAGPLAPTILSGPAATSNNPNPSFSYTVPEVGGSFQYELNGNNPVAAPAGGVTLSGLADGDYTFRIRQVDDLGNAGDFSAPWAFSIDASPPGAPTGLTGPTNPTNVTTPTFAWNGEAGTTFEVQLTGGPTPVGPVAAANPFVAPALAPGTYTFQVVQIDALLNRSAPTVFGPFTIDTARPTGGAIGHVPTAPALVGFSKSTNINVSLTALSVDTIDGTTASTGAITYAVTPNATPPAAASFTAWTVGTPTRPVTVPNTQGPTAISLWARDAAGNISLVAIPVTPAPVVYDTVAPTVAATSFPVPGANVTTGFGTLANVLINFSEPVQNPASLIRMCIFPCGLPIPATVTFDAVGQAIADLDPFPGAPTSALQPGTRYEIQLLNVHDRAGNALTGPGSTPASWTFTTSTDGTPPGPVTNLTLSPGIGQIALAWTRPGDPDLARITVLRGTSPPASAGDATATRFSLPATATSFTDIGLTPGVTYHYAVYAEDAVGNPSNLVRSSATPTAPPVLAGTPIVPPNVSKTPVTWHPERMRPKKGTVLRTLRPLLTWKPVKGARIYNVQIYDGTKKILKAFPKTAKYRVPKGRLKRGHRYTWYVYAFVGKNLRVTRQPLISWFATSKKAK